MEKVEISEKYMLTIPEACAYFNIGEDKMRKMVRDNPDSGYILTNGTKHLIKRKLFEEFLDQTSSI